jgi:hypothetical protein
VSRGGTNDLSNLRVIHAFCNVSKGRKTDEEHAATVASWDEADGWDYSDE